MTRHATLLERSREALAEGLFGWQVTDCRLTMTDCGYASPATSAADYRRLTQLVLAAALERAGTWVCEPLAALTLEIPTSTAPGALGLLGRLGGRVRGQFSTNGLSRLDAELPVARVRVLQQQLPGLSMGKGILESRPGGYQPIGDNPPKRPRSRPSPLERDAWLASLSRRAWQNPSMRYGIEAITLPVSDVDRTKEFYEQAGWHLDGDTEPAPGMRVVQFTPPGSDCSITFGIGFPQSEPGSYVNTYLVVADIEPAHRELRERGIEISDIFHFGAQGQTPGPDPTRGDFRSYASFADPDGNTWLLQEVPSRASLDKEERPE